MMFVESKEVKLVSVDVDVKDGNLLEVSQALIEEIWSKARAIKSAHHRQTSEVLCEALRKYF